MRTLLIPLVFLVLYAAILLTVGWLITPWSGALCEREAASENASAVACLRGVPKSGVSVDVYAFDDDETH